MYLVEKLQIKIYYTADHKVNILHHTVPQEMRKTHVFHAPYYVQGSRFAMQESGYFTSNTFPDTIRHLMANSPPGKKLFILDGHDSHLDVDALDL